MAAHEHELEAAVHREAAALGAAINSPTGKSAGMLVAMLTPQDFVSSLHRACFLAIGALLARNVVPLEYMSVAAELVEQGTFQGMASALVYVSGLTEGVLRVGMLKRIEEIQRGARARRRRVALAAAAEAF